MLALTKVHFYLVNDLIAYRVQPEVHISPLGSPASFGCTSDVEPKWSFQGKWPDGAIISARSVYIPQAKLAHRGYYECNGTYEGREFQARGLLKIKCK